jgi:hypothetical protein
VTEFSDYRNAAGGLVAYSAHQYDGRAQNDLLERVVSLEPAAPDADLSIPQGTGVLDSTAASRS